MLLESVLVWAMWFPYEEGTPIKAGSPLTAFSKTYNELKQLGIIFPAIETLNYYKEDINKMAAPQSLAIL
jgi:hypothetical protein